jgi:hypothetical protein
MLSFAATGMSETPLVASRRVAGCVADRFPSFGKTSGVLNARSRPPPPQNQERRVPDGNVQLR